MNRLLLATLLLMVTLIVLGAARAQTAPPQVGLCAACHGQKGVPVNPAIPVIAGQREGYLYLELRDYKLGNRKNPAMQAVAALLPRAEMLALAAWFSNQPAPDLQQQRASQDVARRAQTINGSAGCEGCHGQGYLGDSAIPRVAGQREEYLLATMLAFKSGARGNNPWMSALLKTYSDADIDTMARYLAGL
jgi:cytochrome c553